nr:protein PET100 homolog, mitochondrial isoform X1 [Macaca fascicularis]
MGVKLEIFRMILYLTFPVAMFWVSNQAEWFEGYVIQRKRELWTPEKLLGRLREENHLNPRGRGCSEPKNAPLHSSLGNRARLRLKKEHFTLSHE